MPTNRYGQTNGLSIEQPNILDEAVTLKMFVNFARLYFDKKMTSNFNVAFGCIAAAEFKVFFLQGAKAP